MKHLVISALLALFIAGCSSTPDTGAEQAGAPVEGPSGVRTVNASGVGSSQLPAPVSGTSPRCAKFHAKRVRGVMKRTSHWLENSAPMPTA